MTHARAFALQKSTRWANLKNPHSWCCHVATQASPDRWLRLSVSRLPRAAAARQPLGRADWRAVRRVQHVARDAKGKTRACRFRRGRIRADIPRCDLRAIQGASPADAGRPACTDRTDAGPGRRAGFSDPARVGRRGGRRDRHARRAGCRAGHGRRCFHRRQGSGATGRGSRLAGQHDDEFDAGCRRCVRQVRRAPGPDRGLPRPGRRQRRQYPGRAQVRAEDRGEMAGRIRLARRHRRKCGQDRRQDRRIPARRAAAIADVAPVGDDQDRRRIGRKAVRSGISRSGYGKAARVVHTLRIQGGVTGIGSGFSFPCGAGEGARRADGGNRRRGNTIPTQPSP